MDETESTTAPTLDTGTEVDHEAAARVASQLDVVAVTAGATNTDAAQMIEHASSSAGVIAVDYQAEPRAQIMYRPVPVPAGYIAVEPEAPFWFLVKLDPTHEPCKGSGKVQGPDENGGTQELYCTCILSAVDECFREVQANGEQHSAELRAERADKQLGERLERVRAKVREIEQECTAAVGDCEKEQAKIEALVPELTAAIEDWNKTEARYKQESAAANAELTKRQLEAARVRDEAVREAEKVFNAALFEITRERQTIAADLQQKLDVAGITKTASDHERAEALDRLAYLKAGPEKIRRRFEDKLQGPRATLERLERQWKR